MRNVTEDDCICIEIDEVRMPDRNYTYVGVVLEHFIGDRPPFVTIFSLN